MGRVFLKISVSFFLFTFIGHAQPLRQKLNGEVYEKVISGRSWGASDSSIVRKGLSIYVVSFSHDTLYFARVNIVEGLYGGNCKYSISFKNNFFEIRPKLPEKKVKSAETEKLVYVYGYLQDEEHMFMLFAGRKLSLGEKLLTEKGWLAMTPVKK